MPTFIWMDGFEHEFGVTEPASTGIGGSDLGVQNLSTDGNVSYDTGRSGSGKSVKFTQGNVNAVGYRTNIPASSVVVFSFYFKYTEGTATSMLARFTTAGTPAPIIQGTTSGLLRTQFTGAANFATTGATTYNDGLWHRFDGKVDVSGSTWTFDWHVDGVAMTQVWIDLQSASSMTQFLMGSTNFSDDATVWFDDVVITATGADYPLGEYAVLTYFPDGDGTHNLGGVISGNSGETTNLWELFDGVPPIASASGGYIQQTGTGASNYAEVTMQNTSIATAIAGVQGMAFWYSSGTAANNGTTRVVDSGGTTLTDVFSGDMSASSTAITGKYAQIAAPGGGWNNTSFNGTKVRVGFSTDATPIPFWKLVVLQIATVPTAAGTFTKTHTTNALVLKTTPKTHTTDAIVSGGNNRTHTTNAFIIKGGTKTHTTNAIILRTSPRAIRGWALSGGVVTIPGANNPGTTETVSAITGTLVLSIMTINTIGTASQITSVTGLGGTWTVAGSSVTTNGQRRITIVYGTGCSGSGQLTINFNATDNTARRYIISDVGPTSSPHVVTTNFKTTDNAAGSATTVSVTPNALAKPTNAFYVSVHHSVSLDDRVPLNDGIEIQDVSSAQGLEANYRTDSSIASVPDPNDRSWVTDFEAGNYPDGVLWGAGGSVNQIAPSESFFNRGFYFTCAIEGASGTGRSAPFNPTGRNAAGALVEDVVPWQTNVLDVINNTANGTYGGGHKLVVVPTVLGIRTGDATWPGHAAITAWTPGDASYVDQCVTAWANLMLQLPVATPVRLWHEQGNGVYGNPSNWAVFIANWRKIYDRWVALGAVAPNKARVVWCPASHPLSPSDDSESWPGEAYVDWIGRDIYLNESTVDWDDAAGLWYDTFNPTTGSLNTTGLPLMAVESGIPTSDSARTAKFQDLATKLRTEWTDIHAWLWWSDADHAWDNDTPPGWRAAVTDILNDTDMLPGGYPGIAAAGSVTNGMGASWTTSNGAYLAAGIEFVAEAGHFHTTDVVVQSTSKTRTHTTNAIVKKALSRTHTTNAFVSTGSLLESTVIHTTNAIIRKTWPGPVAGVYESFDKAVTSNLWFGAYVEPQGNEVDIHHALLRFEAIGGRLNLSRHYLTDWADPFTWTSIRRSSNYGRHPYVSLHATGVGSATWAAVIAGTHDTFLANFATELEGLATRPIFVFHHEPENDPGAGNSTTFIAAAERAYDIMKPNMPNVRFGLHYLRGTFDGGHGGIASWTPNPAKFDFIGASIYDHDGGNSLEGLASSGLSYARSLGKPYFVGESGVGDTDDVSKSKWIRDAAAWVRANTDIIVWDYSETSAQGGDFRVEYSLFQPFVSGALQRRVAPYYRGLVTQDKRFADTSQPYESLVEGSTSRILGDRVTGVPLSPTSGRATRSGVVYPEPSLALLAWREISADPYFQGTSGAADVLGPNLTWVETAGDVDVIDNRAMQVSSGKATGYMGTNLGGLNQWAEIVVTDQSGDASNESTIGLTLRHNTGATTFYEVIARNIGTGPTRGYGIYKVVAGVYTLLGSFVTENLPPTPYTLRFECYGTTTTILRAYANNILKVVASDDSPIASGLRAGYDTFKSGSSTLGFDDFYAGTLAGSWHYTDAYVTAALARTHTTNATIKKSIARTHFTDTFIGTAIPPTTRVHSTDALVKKALTRTHATDALIRASLTRTHTTNAFVSGAPRISFLTDAIIRKLGITVSHTTNAFVAGTAPAPGVAAAWQIDLYGSTGALTSPIVTNANFKAATITWVLDGPGSAEIDLVEDDTGANWPLGQRRVALARNGARLFTGYLTGVSADSQGKPRMTQYNCSLQGLSSILESRVVHGDFNQVSLVGTTIGWNLVNHANVQESMGFTLGTTVGTANSYTRYLCDGDVIAEAINEVAQKDTGGFDWEIDADGRFNTWVGGRGTDKSGTYTVTMNPTLSWRESGETSDVPTYVTAMGDDPDGPCGPPLSVQSQNITGYPRREITISAEHQDATELVDTAKDELKARQKSRYRVDATYEIHTLPWTFGPTGVWLGDVVFVTPTAPYGGTQKCRLIAVSASLEKGQNEFMTYTFELAV